MFVFLSNVEPVFTMDSQTGVLSLSSPLDRETHNFFTLSVSARDRGTPSLSSSVSSTHRHTHQLELISHAHNSTILPYYLMLNCIR